MPNPHKPHPPDPEPVPTIPPPTVPPAPPATAAVMTTAAPPTIAALYLFDLATGRRVADVPDSGIVDLTSLPSRGVTCTLGVDVTGNYGAVRYEPRQSNGALLTTFTRGNRPPLYTRDAADPAGAWLRTPGTYVVNVTAFGNQSGWVTNRGPVRPFNLSITAGVTPDPTPEPTPDTTMPGEVNTTDWAAWTGGRWTPRRGVRYVCNIGKAIAGVTNRIIEPEGGAGPLPVLDFSGAPTSAVMFAFTPTSADFQCQGAPVRVYLGGTDSGRVLASVRGKQHRFSFWAWGGADVYVGRNEGSADVTIDGGGLLGDIHSCFFFGGGAAVGGWADRLTIQNVDIRHNSLWEHLIRMYRVRNGLVRDVLARTVPGSKGSCAFRVNSCAGLRVEASGPDRCVFEGRFNKLGPLNQSTDDPYYVEDLYVGPDVKFKGDVYFAWGTRNVVFDRAVIECGAYYPISVVKSFGDTKGPPTGRFTGVSISATNASGTVISGDPSSVVADGCTITNPTRGWHDRPLSSNFHPQ